MTSETNQTIGIYTICFLQMLGELFCVLICFFCMWCLTLVCSHCGVLLKDVCLCCFKLSRCYIDLFCTCNDLQYCCLRFMCWFASATQCFVQVGRQNSAGEMSMVRSAASRDTGKSPVHASSASTGMPFKEQQLKQLRAQCLVFLAFR